MDLRSDVLAAAHRLGSRWEVAQEIQRLPAHLREGEVVKGMAAGVYGIGTGLLVLTDRRVLVIREGRASQASEGFPFPQLTGVEWTPTSPTHGNITISDATRATGFTQVIAGEASEFMKLLQIVSGAGPAENRQALAAQTSADAQMMWISVSTVFDRVGAGGDGTVVGLSESEAQPPRVSTDSPGPSGGVSIDELVAGSHAAASQPVDTSLGAGGQPPSAVAASSGQGATPPPPPDGATRRSRFRLGLTRKLSA
jgi:hypothetical protein